MTEFKICRDFVKLFNQHKKYNNLGVDDADLFHIPNGGARSQREGANFKKIGVKAGMADYEVIWSKNNIPDFGFLEAKTPRGRLSDKQKEFKSWCDILNIRYATFKDANEGIEILKDWGVIK